MLDWAVPFLLTALVCLLAAAALDERRRPRAFIVVAAALAAPLLVGSALTAAGQAGRFGDLRFSVTSVRLAADAVDGASIGGDRARDFLLVGDLPPALITFRRVSDREVGLTVDRPLRGELAGAVAFEPASPGFLARLTAPPLRFVGERAVRRGEVYCPRGCADPCRVRIPVDGDQLLVSGEAAADMPKMEERGLGVAWSASQRIYPIRTFAVPLSGVSPGDCASALAGDAGKGLPVTAFLFRHGGSDFSNRLYGMFLDGAQSSGSDAVLTRGGPALRIHLYRVDYTDGGVSEEHDRPSRVVERRSVTARLSETGDLTIQFDTPEDLQLRAQDLANVVGTKPGEDVVLPIDNDRGAGRPFIGDSTLQFRSLGGQLAQTALGRVLLHADRRTRNFAPYFTVVGGGQTRNIAFGDRFTLGSSFSAEFVLERLARDSGVLAFVGLPFLLLVAAASLAATWQARRDSLSALLLITLAEVLVAFRLLIAVSGAQVDATAARAFIVPSALFAYLAVPFIVARFTGAPRPFRASLAHALLIAIVGIVAAHDFGLDKTSYLVGFAVAALVIADAVMQPAVPQAVRDAILKLGRDAAHAAAAPLRWLREQTWYANDVVRPLVWLGVLVALRLALLLVGVKEGVPVFGFRVALSTIYLPIGLLLLAQLLFALRTGGLGLWRPLLWAFAVLVVFGAPIAARDTGFVIFAIGTALTGVLALMDQRRQRVDGWSWANAALFLPLGFLFLCYVLLHSFIVDNALGFVLGGICVLAAVAIALASVWQTDRLARLSQWLPLGLLGLAAVLLIVPFVTIPDVIDAAFVAAAGGAVFLVLWKRPQSAWMLPVAFALALGLSFQLPVLPSATFASAASAHDRTAERELDDQMHKTQNILRIWYSVRPDDVGDFGTSSAQNLGAAMAHLHDYGACPQSRWPGCLSGHGYLAIPRPTVLAPYQLNDNVTAIHLIAPFGRLGAAAFLVFLGVTALLYTRAVMRAETRIVLPPPLKLAAVAALWTMFGAALYMILANLEVLPFTGKNVYFLAASSGSDLLEGTLLIVLAMLAVREPRA